MFTFLAIMFAVSALVLFIAAFNQITKGRMGAAALFGVTAVVIAGIAGGLATAID
jgi:hypothetical protein